MVAVTVRFRNSAKGLEDYLKENRACEYSAIDCSQDDATRDFLATQEQHNKTRGNQAIHIIQSWSPEQSQNITSEQAQTMGNELAQKAFPNHEALIVTHFDKKHLHNHLMINPINYNTGERTYNKLNQQDRVREIANEISLSRGMEIIIPKDNSIRRSSTDHQIRKSGRFSYNNDLETKALFSSKYARNFQEHSAIMSSFNIVTKVQNKNTSYLHPERTRYKRGANLSPELANDALNKKFKENRLKYPDQKIFEIIKDDPEYNKLLAVTIQRKAQRQKQKLYLKSKGEAIESSQDLKLVSGKKFQGIMLINEKGERFFITNKDSNYQSIFNKLYEKTHSSVNTAKDIQYFKKSDKMLVTASDGRKFWLNKDIDLQLFNQNKIKGYYNFNRVKHHYINSNYQKNKFESVSKKSVAKDNLRLDASSISALLKENPYIQELNIAEHKYNTDIFAQLLDNNKNTTFNFQGKNQSLEKEIETLSR